MAMALMPERQTLLIVRAGTVIGMPAACGGLARRDLAGAGLQDLAHDDVLDLLGGDARLLESALDGDATEVRSGEVLERAEEPTHGGPGTGDDHGGGTVSSHG